MGCPPVRGDNPRASEYVQVEKHVITMLYHLHQCRHCTNEIFRAKFGKGVITFFLLLLLLLYAKKECTDQLAYQQRRIGNMLVASCKIQ